MCSSGVPLGREMGRPTFVWDLWLSGLCAGMLIIDPEFNP